MESANLVRIELCLISRRRCHQGGGLFLIIVTAQALPPAQPGHARAASMLQFEGSARLYP